MLGWPDQADHVKYGGRLNLVPGLMLFVPAGRVNKSSGGGERRPVSVGWPSADILFTQAPTAMVAAGHQIGATIRSNAGRDVTVHDYGMSINSGASRSYVGIARPYGVVSRETLA